MISTSVKVLKYLIWNVSRVHVIVNYTYLYWIGYCGSTDDRPRPIIWSNIQNFSDHQGQMQQAVCRVSIN